MKSKKYWIERTAALEEALQDAAADITEDIIRSYERAIEEINIDIHNTFKAYVAMGIPEKEATRLLNAAENDKLYKELQELYASTEDFTVREDILNRINAQAYGARISRLEGVKSKAYIRLRQVANLAEKKQKQLYTKTLQSSYYTNIYNIAKGLKCGIDFTVLPEKAINKVLHEPWHGKNYSERIWIHNDRFISAVQDAITTGIISGQSVNRVASTLTEYVKDTAPDGVITSTTTLVRTETSHFMNQGQLEAYKDIGITRYRFVAALSDRTCDTCGDLDSKVFDIEDAVEGKNYPPIHPNCRCTTVMADAISSTRAAEDPLTGKTYKVDGNMTFNEWKDSLTDEQLEAMNSHVREMRNSSADKKQYEKYKAVLGEDNMPKTLEKFTELKYNDNDKWTELKYKYRAVNRYEIEGKVPIDKIMQLDNAAYYTKQKGFDYSNLHGKDRKDVKNLQRAGNAASMELDGITYFSHSRVSKKGTLEYNAYKGKYPIVGIKGNRKYSVLDLGDSIPRQHDTEAKFFEFVADHKKPSDKFTITILSEKHMCDSCRYVMQQFKSEFPNATVNIISGKRGYNGSAEGLKTWTHRKKVK